MNRTAHLAATLAPTAMTSIAGPVTNDLWDSSQAGFSGPVHVSGSGSFCWSFLNILGGWGNNGGGGAFSDTFDALGFNSTSFRWNTATVSVGRIILYSPSNFNGGEANEMVGIKLCTLDSNNQNPVLFYDSGVIPHNPANDGTTPLLDVTLASAVTSNNWRLDILDQPSAQGGPIYRVIELDAFVPASAPEPATLVLTITSVACLIWLRRRTHS